MHTRSSPAFGAVKLTGREAFPVILGFNAAGTVAEVGSGVSTLTVGDRVTGFSVFGAGRKGGPKGTMQQFVLLPSFQCSKVPQSLALDAAATIPDNFITAFYTIFDQLALPIPTSFLAATPPPIHETPILVYGAGATAGQYAVQLLRAAGYNNISATASPAHHEYLRSLGATHVFDYRSPTLAAEVAKAGTLARIAEVLRPTGTVAVLLPIKQGDKVAVGDAPMYWEIPTDRNPFAPETTFKYVRTFLYGQNEFLRDNLMPRILPELLEQGLIKPNRVRLLDQGTFKERVAEGLDLLRNNSVSGEKIIVKVP
ncbi:hypothetical protein C8R47DRAFT_1172669 [Mycena vitilis]|nr:hypothetical protein C8R47DRAFT_1181549 [Mycena vitilis]KAJ6517957.1 hypothetical protein C8R47DRAFT_1172669 [Mycena vitilis]